MPQKPRAPRLNRVVTEEETSIQKVLEDAESVTFADETARKEFEKKHLTRLSKDGSDSGSSAAQGKDEVLHVIAEKSKPLGNHKKFLEWVIKAHRPLLECKSRNGGGETPLHRAIGEKNHEFVQLVLDNVEAEVLLKHSTDLGETCLHYAIRHSSPFTESIISCALEVSNNAAKRNSIDGYNEAKRLAHSDIFKMKTKDGRYEGMTPLHMALWMEEEEEPVSDIKGNVALDDPSPKQPNPKLDRSGKTDGAIHTPEKSLANVKARRPGMPLEEPKTTQEAQIPKEDLASFSKAKKYDRLQIVMKLIKAAPRVLVDCKDSWDDTPFQARLAVHEERNPKPQDVTKVEEWRQEIFEKDDILLFMREFIIEEFTRRDAMTALYKVGEERVLEFDLTGLPYSTINTDFLKGLGKVLRFEGLLKYVALPRLTVEDDDSLESADTNSRETGKSTEQDGGSNSQKEASKAKGKGIQNMYTIFRWLKKCNVKSVLTVTVVDNVEPSHSDEVIEACMEKLDVQYWNWYKIDLCCDVIINSAKSARDVTLYSSGNNAVLVGWSSTAGLAKLEKLERVHIYVQEGLERPNRMKQQMSTFEKTLKKNHKCNINVTWDLLKSDPNYNSVFTNRGAEKTSESKWMKSMIDFAALLKMAKKEKSAEPIKIAIIDDGINMALSAFADNVKGGESFYRLSELSGRRGAYYAPLGPHGTLMAQLISEVCPVADLYIAQLELLPGQDGGRSFTAESAIEAVSWAVKKGVDIISMSWSINTSKSLTRLENALLEARRKRIIMFCASIDEGATALDNTYPGKGNHCIKIGATTGTGAKLSWVSEKDSDFLLPGEAPPPASEANLWNNPHTGSHGSSVSTALAAGLAGALLYCDRLIGTPPVEPDSDPSDPEGAMSQGTTYYPEKVDYLRNWGNMPAAFKNLSKNTEYQKFPQVWDHLNRFKDMKWNTNSWPDKTELTREALKEFMAQLKA